MILTDSLCPRPFSGHNRYSKNVVQYFSAENKQDECQICVMGNDRSSPHSES